MQYYSYLNIIYEGFLMNIQRIIGLRNNNYVAAGIFILALPKMIDIGNNIYYIARYRNFIFNIDFYKFLSMIPYFQKKIQHEIDKTSDGIREELDKQGTEYNPYINLPLLPIKKGAIIDHIRELKELENKKQDLKLVSGVIYNHDENLNDLMLSIYPFFYKTNPLHADIFPYLRNIEKDLIRMTLNLYNGSKESRGTLTSGGTESILCACKAYRDYGLKIKGIKNPIMLVPESAHAAFDKAGESFGIKIIKIPIDENYELDIGYLETNINKNVVCIVGSAPSFPHGIMDPIKKLGEIGINYDIPVHVDCCLGGFLIPFMENRSEFDFDFSVDGVTSISCDYHKYGYSPKGISIIMYESRKYIDYQYYIEPDWMGGIYATHVLTGSRPGNIIVQTWATMLYYGIEGYKNNTNLIIETANYIRKELDSIENIYVIGDSKLSVIGLKSDKYNIYKINDKLKEKGWHLNVLQNPSSIHICVTEQHVNEEIHSKFIDDIKEIIGSLSLNENQEDDNSTIYGTNQKVKKGSIIRAVVLNYLDYLYH